MPIIIFSALILVLISGSCGALLFYYFVMRHVVAAMTVKISKLARISGDIDAAVELQQQCMPLDTDKYGKKGTTLSFCAEKIQVFGYFQGAEPLSGDYIDYIRLNERHFAVIKCDVAGKGVAAALGMMQVASLFHNYFQDKRLNSECNLPDFCYALNSLIEPLNVKRHFVAFSLCVLDAETGRADFCNAGDNIVYWWDAAEQALKSRQLPPTPAAGSLPSEWVKHDAPYTVQTLYFKRGDVLFLLSDGIEESSKRIGSTNAKTSAGEERFGRKRWQGLVSAAMRRSRWNLVRKTASGGEEKFGFVFAQSSSDAPPDTSDVLGGGAPSSDIQAAVLGLAAAEKIFRSYRLPLLKKEKTGGYSAEQNAEAVQIDENLDIFLKTHLNEYARYCGGTSEKHFVYSRLGEDRQVDDIAILAVQFLIGESSLPPLSAELS